MRVLVRTSLVVLSVLGWATGWAAAQETQQSPEAAQQPEQATLQLEEVSLPELSALEKTVAEQLQADYMALLNLLARPEVNAQELAEAFGLLGQTLQAYELLSSAENCYRNAHLLDPASFDWLYLLAEVLRAQGRLEQAIALFEQARLLDPQHLPCLVRIGDSFLQLSRLDEAQQSYEAAAALDPSAPAVQAGLGKVALARHDLETAVQHLQAAVQAVPAANSLHYSLAMAYRGLGNMDLARHHLELSGSVGLRVPDPLVDGLRDRIQGERAFVLRGRLAFAAGHYGDAAVAFAKAVAAAPGSTTALVNLGSAIGMLGDVEGAIERYRQALQIEPDNITAHHNIGELLVFSQRYLEAEKHLRRVLELNPDDPRPHLLLADALRSTNRHDEALEHLAIATALDPAADISYLRQSEILTTEGRHAEALELLERAYGLLPGEGRIVHALARLLAASPDPQLRDGARAVELARQVVDVMPLPVHMQTLALALAESGNCEEAAIWQAQVIAEMVAANDLDQLPALRESLLRYRAGAPCRPPFPTTKGQ